MRLLVTRPEADAARTAQALRASGHEAVVAPVLRVESIDAKFGGPFDARAVHQRERGARDRGTSARGRTHAASGAHRRRPQR